MAQPKYLIVDSEKLKSRQCSNLDEYLVLLTESILSPEETEAKFFEIYSEGVKLGNHQGGLGWPHLKEML